MRLLPECPHLSSPALKVRIKREEVRPDRDRSFRILLTPHLEEVFFWHYHPEYELVYIEGTDGNRHIGEHLARYSGSDLAFIGPYVPHLNFDYGARREHLKVVIQLHADFMGADFLKKPELADIRGLFERARGALYFTGAVKQAAGEKLKKLPDLEPFEQLMTLFEVFRMLARSADAQSIDAKPIAGEQNFREQRRLKIIRQHVAEHYQNPVELKTVAELAHLSKAAFCRYFKKSTGQTFTDYLNRYRIQQAQQLLLQNKTATEACFGSGFENLSHFNKTFKKIVGENPLRFKKKSVWRSANDATDRVLETE
jgi:AraC-like DNA-binding protein